ncbi:MAG: hypothetical protein QXI39_07450 [Candidatus Bathyarchaeia archaeon]
MTLLEVIWALSPLMNLFQDKRIFRRRRKPARLKALAVALYHAGLSPRKARDLLRSLGYSVSHEAIRRWYLKLRAFMPSLGRKVREAVAMDGTRR